MNYLDVAEKIFFLIPVLVSFYILITVISCRNRITEGYLFIITFILNLLPFFIPAPGVSNALTVISEFILLASFVIIILMRNRPIYPGYVFFSLLTAAVITILLNVYIESLPQLFAPGAPLSFMPAVCAIINMFLLKKTKGSKSVLFWAMALFAGMYAIHTYIGIMFIKYLFMLAKAGAYALFAVYFMSRSIWLLESKIYRPEN